MNVLSLFSGIGGLELGLERAGMTVVGQVEIDEFCRRVLAKHWPEVPRHDDVRTCVEWWRSKRRPPVHLVAGGFCCQPASSAGLKLGPEDERWLWPEFAAVVAALGPEWVVWENVSGLRTRGLDVVLRDLDHLGYVCRVGEISACEMGAPHPRARLLGVAHAIGEGRCPWRADRRGASSPRVEQQDGAEPAGGAWWAVEPAVGRVAYGVPGRVDRARALGNAVVPAVSEYIGRLILPFWEGGMTQPIEPGAAMGELRARIAQAIMAEDLLQDDRAKNEPDYCSVDARVDAVMSVLASWQSLMSLLDEHYPPEVFDGSSGDEGPRIVALTREIDRLQHEIMGYQSPGGEYDRGHEHGSDVAAKFRAERDRERASRQAWAEEAGYLQHLLEQFVDRDPCWFDHHGGCQAHGFLDIEAGQLCPQEEVRRALDDGLADHIPRVCLCITDEQAAALPPGFSRPVCAVHPEVTE